MTQYDEALRQLHQQVLRQSMLADTLDELEQQRRTLAGREKWLAQQEDLEQADVQRLEKRSLTTLFYNAIGKMDDKLDKEHEEAMAAAAAHDDAIRQLEELQRQIHRATEEYNSLVGSGARYQQLLFKKTEALKAAGTAVAERIAEAEEKIGFLEEQQRRVYEAVQVGREALDLAYAVQQEMGGAENWALAGLLGSTNSTFAKYDHLNAAEAQVKQLQGSLDRFHKDLVDVSALHITFPMEIDPLLQFADTFFTFSFVDMEVASQIAQAAQHVDDLVETLEQLMQQLESLCQEGEQNIQTAKRKLERQVLDA